MQSKSPSSSDSKNKNSIAPQDMSPSGGTVNVAAEDIKSAIYAIVNTIGERPASSKFVEYKRPFVIDDEKIKSINTRIETIMSEILPFPGAGLRFNATAKMPDNTGMTFDNFDKFLEMVGDQQDPAKIKLIWEQRLSFPFSAIASIIVELDTGVKIKDDISSLIDERRPYIKLIVSGATDEWVGRAFQRIEPVLKNTILRGIYAPFYLLRNLWVNIVFLSGIAAVVWKIPFDQLGLKFFDTSAREAVYKQIIADSNINTKIDKLSHQIMLPINENALIGRIFPIFLFMITIIMITLFTSGPLKVLIPRSYIAIGLAKGRYLQYENAFKFLIFTLLTGLIISGIIVPLMRDLFSK